MALLRSPLPESATIVAGLISQHDAPVGNILWNEFFALLAVGRLTGSDPMPAEDKLNVLDRRTG